MDIEGTKGIAEELLSRLGSGSSPEFVATLFSPDLVWSIPGDPTALPWVGQKTGREAVVDFVRFTREMLDPIRFTVHDVISNGIRSVILGDLASLVKRTGKTIETPFAMVLTISESKIIRFQMLEDSFAVSLAARF